MKHMFVAVFILLFCNNVYAKGPYSGSGRNPPKKLSERQISVLKNFVPLIKWSGEDPFVMTAIAMVESSLTESAISRSGDYGILQVNCRIHSKKLKKLFGFKHCKKDMLDMRKNIVASAYVLSRFRKYRACRKHHLYACYNGGQGWKAVLKKCMEEKNCEAPCRKCNRPARYANSVKKHIRFLKRKYSDLILSLSSAEYTPAATE